MARVLALVVLGSRHKESRAMLTRRFIECFLVLVVGLTVGGCGSSGSSGPSINVTGTYRINGISNRVGSFSATATIQQNGSSGTGTYRNSLGGEFRLEGSVSGTHFSGRAVGTNNPAICTIEGDMFQDGSAGSGSYSCQTGESGTLTIVKIG